MCVLEVCVIFDQIAEICFLEEQIHILSSYSCSEGAPSAPGWRFCTDCKISWLKQKQQQKKKTMRRFANRKTNTNNVFIHPFSAPLVPAEVTNHKNTESHQTLFIFYYKAPFKQIKVLHKWQKKVYNIYLENRNKYVNKTIYFYSSFVFKNTQWYIQLLTVWILTTCYWKHRHVVTLSGLRFFKCYVVTSLWSCSGSVWAHKPLGSSLEKKEHVLA